MKKDNIGQLFALIEKATSQFHTVEAAKEQLLEYGFEELFWKEDWKLQKGGKYLLVHHGSTIFAWTVGEHLKAGDSFRIAAAHGDFPAFRIKPRPEIVKEGYVQLNVETYGGVNLASWLDRGLSAAGRVILKSDDVFRPKVRLVDLKKPIFTIPNLAIHLNREMNQGTALNRQTEMLPLAGMAEEMDKTCFMNYLAEQLGVEVSDILDYELNVYNTDKAQQIGMKGEFISAPRLDNLTSVQALLTGIAEGGRADGINLTAVFDHEEIGSRTKQGAGSAMLGCLLEKIYHSLGMTEMDCKNAMEDSLLMSVDVSHAFHPSYAEKYDLTNKNKLNQGFAIKEACAQSYATDSEAVAIVQQICEKEGIAYQKFVNRSDVTGGGTLGSIASAMLPVRTVDMGVPLLAMHSSRELMGTEDEESLIKFMKAYFSIK